MNDLHIQTKGQLLILSERDLMQCLSSQPEIHENAICQGKGYLRVMSTAARQADGFDRWQLYETLKGNRSIDKDTLSWISGMDVHEMREGLLEYLTAISR